MDREKVLNAYRNGDESRRLGLFLAYRDLRDQFTLIEQESSPDDFLIIRFPWSRHRSKKQPLPRAA